MNFVRLVAHGLSAISVFGDIVGARLLVLTSLLIALAVAGIGCATVIRLTTSWAIPGWTTYAVGLLLVVLLQAIMFLVMFSLMVLGARNATGFLPIRDYAYFVDETRTIGGEA